MLAQCRTWRAAEMWHSLIFCGHQRMRAHTVALVTVAVQQHSDGHFSGLHARPSHHDLMPLHVRLTAGTALRYGTAGLAMCYGAGKVP